MSKSPLPTPFDGEQLNAELAAAPTSIDVARSPQQVSEVKQGGGQLVVTIEPAALCNIFGVADPGVANTAPFAADRRRSTGPAQAR